MNDPDQHPNFKDKAAPVFVSICCLWMGSLVAVLLLAGGCSTRQESSRDNSDAGSSAIAKLWGVRPVSIQLTATDYMLDFRYQVLDANKAAAIINRKTRPYLIVEKTGVQLHVPSSYKIGPLRQSAQFAQPERTYFMLFANPGRHVKAGDLVTVMAGDFKLEHLTVQ